MGVVTRSERQQLIELLLQLPNINNAAARNLLLADLPRDLQNAVAFDSSPSVHIANIVELVNSTVFNRLSDGSVPLLIVIENAMFMVRGSALGRQLQGLYKVVQLRTQDPPGQTSIYYDRNQQPSLVPRGQPQSLAPDQQQQLYEALLNAFPKKSDLEQVVQFGLGKNIDVIAGGSNLAETVLHLVQWANAQGQVENLIRAAHKANPHNADLAVVATRVGLVDSQEDL